MRNPSRALGTVIAVLLLGLTTACAGSEPAIEPRPDDRTVTHAMGEARVPAEPKRVVVLDTGELDAVLALGMEPVGMVLPDAAPSLPDYLGERVRDVPIVGTIGSPNLEKIATLEPDLILSSKVRDGERYDMLSELAPTVFSETVGKTWKENLRLNAEALGREQQAHEILDRYQRKARALGELVGDPAQTRVSAVRFTADADRLRLYDRGSFLGTILDDAGFARPANQHGEETFAEVSRENIGEADGDLLFHGAYGETGAQQQDRITGSQQWQTLDAVRSGNAHEVPDDLWYLGLGPIAADRVLDDMRTTLEAN
ncbi:iron-siderophore ABC transporter substrate-binding protein [Saccharopolyspora sp. HNM0983]|uniref:Iron-siderophore ABC transporter substrate-binding protein n=1 Tax=Saccharopolyspora montiporae TaxID=2781240 RepID=A0A929FZ88_9PSEU|nr:iron-siderophore ABC transporter substrate-binding protein [Saccharopolyspora sp. HNM0983]MBE9373492.1 iron-siderophore ABC transporter substrate-binding protein [Saccharopolyspora sp. HNM0983]